MATKEEIISQLKKLTDWECSSSPEGNWHDCCVRHDYDYVEGEGKWTADARLAWCISKKGHPLVGLVYWLGVTVGGWKPYLKYKRAREMADT